MRLLVATYLSCVVLTACGGGSAGSPSPAAVGSSSPAAVTATPTFPQLAQAFAAINVTANTSLTAASQQLQAAATIDQVKGAVAAAALAAYLAFDSGLQGLHLPASLQADVTTQFHADSKVEADYQNAETDASLSQMQATLSTVGDDSNTAGAATIVLRRDLGLPPTS